VLLYRDCLNEVGWAKRREFEIKAGIKMEEDDVWAKAFDKEEKEGIPDMPWLSAEDLKNKERTKTEYSMHS
jgi:hypothetical protein